MLERPGVKQFIKFCVVGGTSFIIDTGLTFLLVRWITIDGELMSVRFGRWLLETMPGLFSFASKPEAASAPILIGIAVLVAILNSFVWNRLWTFGIRGSEDRLRQLQRFYVVSLVGYLINVSVTSVLFNVIPGHPNQSLLAAKVVAAAIVAFWNFFGQKLWAFKPSTS